MRLGGLRKLIPRLAITWAIAFAALLGVVSAIAQLYPPLEGVPYALAGLLILSALVAGCYAWMRANPDPFPINELLPEVLSSSPRYSLECSTDRAAVLSVHRMTEEVYPGVAPLPTERYEQWLIRNQNIFVCLFDQSREVCGYFDVFPLRSDFMSLLVDGAVGEQDIRHEHVLSPADSGSLEGLYLAGLAVKDWDRFEGKRCAAILLWGLTKYFDHFFPEPPKRTLYAHAVTARGEALLKRFRFKVVSEAEGRRDPYRLYAADIDAQFRSIVRANVPDYTGMVNLTWQKRRSLKAVGGRVA